MFSAIIINLRVHIVYDRCSNIPVYVVYALESITTKKMPITINEFIRVLYLCCCLVVICSTQNTGECISDVDTNCKTKKILGKLYNWPCYVIRWLFEVF